MACLRWSLGLASRLRPLFAMPRDRFVDEPGFFVIPTVSYENRPRESNSVTYTDALSRIRGSVVGVLRDLRDLRDSNSSYESNYRGGHGGHGASNTALAVVCRSLVVHGKR